MVEPRAPGQSRPFSSRQCQRPEGAKGRRRPNCRRPEGAGARQRLSSKEKGCPKRPEDAMAETPETPKADLPTPP